MLEKKALSALSRIAETFGLELFQVFADSLDDKKRGKLLALLTQGKPPEGAR